LTKISTEVDSLSRSISLDMSYRLITEERDNEVKHNYILNIFVMSK